MLSIGKASVRFWIRLRVDPAVVFQEDKIGGFFRERAEKPRLAEVVQFLERREGKHLLLNDYISTASRTWQTMPVIIRCLKCHTVGPDFWIMGGMAFKIKALSPPYGGLMSRLAFIYIIKCNYFS